MQTIPTGTLPRRKKHEVTRKFGVARVNGHPVAYNLSTPVGKPCPAYCRRPYPADDGLNPPEYRMLNRF